MYDLSPEAAKAVAAGRARSALRAMALSPRLARTATLAVILRPAYGGKRHQVAVATWVRATLPAFRFNAKANRWEAPIDALAAAVEAFTAKGLPAVNMSAGAREFLAGKQKGE
jgi:hypothetical protein